MGVSPFGALAVIADLTAASGRVRIELPALERSLEGIGLEYDLRTARAPGDVTGLASAALDEGFRFLVAAGDDATAQAVVNALFREGRPVVDDVVLGIVPAGTGSDLARSFGLPDGTEGACRHLAGDTTYPFDVMKITYTDAAGERITRYAANLAEVGMGGEVARRQRAAGTPPTNLRRFLGFWSGWLRSKPVRVRVDADHLSWEGRAFNVIIGNGQFIGGLRMSPRSFPGDGILDALVFHGPRSDAYTMLPRVFRHGDHVPDANIKEMRAKIRIAVDADRPLAIAADGVPLGTTPAIFQVVPQQILLKL